MITRRGLFNICVFAAFLFVIGIPFTMAATGDSNIDYTIRLVSGDLVTNEDTQSFADLSDKVKSEAQSALPCAIV